MVSDSSLLTLRIAGHQAHWACVVFSSWFCHVWRRSPQLMGESLQQRHLLRRYIASCLLIEQEVAPGPIRYSRNSLPLLTFAHSSYTGTTKCCLPVSSWCPQPVHLPAFLPSPGPFVLAPPRYIPVQTDMAPDPPQASRQHRRPPFENVPLLNAVNFSKFSPHAVSSWLCYHAGYIDGSKGGGEV